VADEKKYLRQILSETRSALPLWRAASLANSVQQRLLQSACYRAARCVVLYAAKHNEVQTERILTDALATGRRVLFPRVVPKTHDLVLVEVGDPAALRPGAFGILEPSGIEIVPPGDLGRALVCVPGVAFSLTGERLGRGGGYYDRLIACLAPQALTAGLAYSFQVLDRLAQSPHDRRLDLIVTECAVHAAGTRQQAAAAHFDQGGVPRCS
jgi:5-formyltetrahydrofolate cyclo-ligase